MINKFGIYQSAVFSLLLIVFLFSNYQNEQKWYLNIVYPHLLQFNIDQNIIPDNSLFLFGSTKWLSNFNVTKCINDSRFQHGSYRISSNFAEFEQAKVVIFHPHDFNFGNLPRRRPEGQLWVWLNLEPPQHVSIYYGISDGKFNYTASYKSDSDIFLPYGHFVNKSNDFVYKKPCFKSFKEKKKLACILVSNLNSPFRNFYIGELKKYLEFDIYGNRNKYYPRNLSKCDLISQYKFYLSFENTNHSDYITEKFWENALECGTVPIIHGTLKKNFLKQGIPADSFIHTDDFHNASELADYVNKVANDENLYNSYFRWRKGRDIHFQSSFGMYYCAVVDFFVRNHPKPRKNISISKWYPKDWHL